MEYLAVLDEEEMKKDPLAESVTPFHMNHPEGENPTSE